MKYTLDEFKNVWNGIGANDILNQFYYEHIELQKALERITNLQQELNEYKFPNCKTKDIEVVRANLVDMMRKNKRLEQENERLKKGIYKILKLNEYMIHCESKEVIYKFLMKQWRTIYETLGIPEPGLARCSKNNLQNGSDSQ